MELWKGPCIIPCCTTGTHFCRYPSLSNINHEEGAYALYQKLIELKIEHNVGQLDADRIRAFQQKIKSPWASNLPIFVFTYLLDEGYKQLANINEALPSKGNDMELFHFLSAGPHVIDYAPGMLRKNLKDIEDLILNKRFTPFPPRPKTLQLDLNNDPHIHQPPITEEYPSKDG